MIINSKFHNSIFYKGSISLSYMGVVTSAYMYVRDLSVAEFDNFHHVYQEGLYEDIKLSKAVSSDHLAAFICIRNIQYSEINVEIEGIVKTIGDWHKYFISDDLGLYLQSLRKFKFFTQLENRFRVSLAGLVSHNLVNKYFNTYR